MNHSEKPLIVLIPGIARFDFLRSRLIDHVNSLLGGQDEAIETDLTHYFKGIRRYLIDHGFEVSYAYTGFAEDLDVRRHFLKASIDRLCPDNPGGQRKCHLIGHSMGGLDARHLLFKEPEMQNKIASVTSLGTPHLGTVFARYILVQLGTERLIDRAQDDVAIDFRGFKTLTPSRRKAFNKKSAHIEATNSVCYIVYTSWQQQQHDIYPPLLPSWEIVHSREGINDGLVSYSSQRWHPVVTSDVDGTVKKIHRRNFPVAADHLNQTGRWEIGEVDRDDPLAVARKQAYEAQIKEAYLEMARDAVRTYNLHKRQNG